MVIPRFYIASAIPDSGIFALTDDVHRHVQVLRLKNEDCCDLFNGDGKQYRAQIQNIQKKETTVHILESKTVHNESPLKIILAQGISLGERMDFVVQKATELGVFKIIPLMTAYSQMRLNVEHIGKKLIHWKKIIISACEQSGRCLVPEIESPLPFGEWIQQKHGGYKFIADTEGLEKIKSDTARTEKMAHILIGPEGGWSPAEMTDAKNAGFSGVSLGPRILRTETAALTAISLLQKMCGDF